MKLLSVEEAMDYLGVGRTTFVKLDIPYIKVFKSKKYRARDLDAWINSNRVSPCEFTKEKPRPSGTTRFRSTEIGFAEARAQLTKNSQKHL